MTHLFIGETVIPRLGTKWNGCNVGGVPLFVEHVYDDGVTEPLVELSSTQWADHFHVRLADVLHSVWDQGGTNVNGLVSAVLLALGAVVLVVAVQIARSSTVGAWCVGVAAVLAVGGYLYRKWSKR
jgi:hypothetical protein